MISSGGTGHNLAKWGPADNHENKYGPDSPVAGGLGYGFWDYSSRSITRGGNYMLMDKAGLFAADLRDGPSAVSELIGFRCVYGLR